MLFNSPRELFEKKEIKKDTKDNTGDRVSNLYCAM